MPRSNGAGSSREPPNASCRKSGSGAARLATCAGKPAISARRSGLRSACSRSSRRCVQPLDQGAGNRRRSRRPALPPPAGEREGRAPDLAAPFAVEVVEELA